MMENHLSETRPRTEQQESRSFDPDQRVDVKQTETNKGSEPFNPDKRFQIDNIKNESDKETKKTNESTDKADAIEKTYTEYIQDIKEKSECSDTISDNPFSISELREVSHDENVELRSEFNSKKVQLIREWEHNNGREWPKYKEDVVNESGIVIRKAGQPYDAHHILPLCIGGKNEARNITPLHADVHYDAKGVHASGSPFDRLKNLVGGKDNG